MKFKNNFGTSKIISVYWFAILILVAGTIAYMVSVFYGAPYDIREIEGNTLINHVVSCLSNENGMLKYHLTDEFQKNFLENCHLNFKTKNKEEQYYLEVKFYDFNNQKNPLKFKIIEGNINLKTFFNTAPSSNSIFKSEKSFYVLNKKNGDMYGTPKELVVKVTSIIRKTEKNVAQ